MSDNLTIVPASREREPRRHPRRAAAAPDATALIDGGGAVSYARARRARARPRRPRSARRGVGPGDRVAIVLPNATAFVAAYFGALRTGAVVVPLNVLLRSGEIDERLAARLPGCVVTDAERAGLVAEPASGVGIAVVLVDELAGSGAPGSSSASASDPAVILFTSGTSGVSKGAVLTHGGIAAAAAQRRRGARVRPGGRGARRGAVLARARPVDGPRRDARDGRRGRRRRALRPGRDARDDGRDGHDGDARRPDDVHRPLRGRAVGAGACRRFGSPTSAAPRSPSR